MLAVYPTTDGPLVRGFYTMVSGSGIVLIPLPHVRFRPGGEDTFEKCGVQREERRESEGKKEGTESESEEARKERRKEGSKLRRQRGRKRRKRIEKGSPELPAVIPRTWRALHDREGSHSNIPQACC